MPVAIGSRAAMNLTAEGWLVSSEFDSANPGDRACRRGVQPLHALIFEETAIGGRQVPHARCCPFDGWVHACDFVRAQPARSWGTRNCSTQA